MRIQKQAEQWPDQVAEEEPYLRFQDISPNIIFDPGKMDPQRAKDLEDALVRRTLNEVGDPSLPPVPLRGVPLPSSTEPRDGRTLEEQGDEDVLKEWYAPMRGPWKPRLPLGRWPNESPREHANRRSVDKFLQYRDKPFDKLNNTERLRLQTDRRWQEYRRQNGL